MGQSGMQAGETIAGRYRLNEAYRLRAEWRPYGLPRTYSTERQFAIKFMHSAVRSKTAGSAPPLSHGGEGLGAPSTTRTSSRSSTSDRPKTARSSWSWSWLQGLSLETAIHHQSPPMVLSEFNQRDDRRCRAPSLRLTKNGRRPPRSQADQHLPSHDPRVGRRTEAPGLRGQQISGGGQSFSRLRARSSARPLYMSPEQAMGLDSIRTERVRTFCGSAPFSSRPCAARARTTPRTSTGSRNDRHEAAKSIDEVSPHLPEALRSILRDCLSRTRKNATLPSFD